MLSIRELNAWYGKSHVLQGVELDVPAGQIVSLLGRNGVGRSTTLKAVMGEVTATGSITLDGVQLLGREPHMVARAGVAYVPESRDVFPEMSVSKNLRLGMKPGREGQVDWRVAELVKRFSNLAERAEVNAGSLSGGEQQMLTMCRSLLGNPSVILVDEPTEGLAPRIVEEVASLLREIAARGVGVLLVEQKLSIALEVSSHVYVMGRGHIVFSGTPGDLRDNPDVTSRWLAV